jgi:hypothetical protein
MRLRHAFAFLLAAVGGELTRAETVSFLLTGPIEVNRQPESYVVTTSDPAQIAQARAYLRETSHITFLYARVRIAAGADGVNRNYSAPGYPAWDWRVTELLSWRVLDPRLARTADVVTTRDGSLAGVPEILRGNITPIEVDQVTRLPIFVPQDTMALLNYTIAKELPATPMRSSRMLNVSQRGYVGAGERAMIVGFVIEGEAPRSVVVRVLGPSLRAFGVTEVLADPKLEVYRGAEKIAENDVWTLSTLMREPSSTVGATPPVPRGLWPTDLKEPGVELSLLPGAYTIVVRGADGGSGIALAEVYDLSGI